MWLRWSGLSSLPFQQSPNTTVLMIVTLPYLSTLHSDSASAIVRLWSPKFLKKIHDICINQLRDCSFGSFGDGQYMQMQPDPNVGLPRLISAPTRPAT